jgi:hypothetical protein
VAIVLPKFSRRRPSTGLATETQPAVNISLCRENGMYEAGGPLTAKWRISRVPLDEIQGLEVSVLWHTEGKGDEDLHVHHFHRVVESRIRRVGLADEQSIHCMLPATPLSYHGRLISVRWCIRLRLFLTSGREIVAEQPFHMVSPDSVSPCSSPAVDDSPVAEPSCEDAGDCSQLEAVTQASTS